MVALPLTLRVPFRSTLSLISTSPELESRINLLVVVVTVLPSILTLSISALPLTSRTPSTVVLSKVVAPSTSKLPITCPFPSTSNVSI